VAAGNVRFQSGITDPYCAGYRHNFHNYMAAESRVQALLTLKYNLVKK
jgi:hypothetical protein